MGFHPPTLFASDKFYFLGFPLHPKYRFERNVKGHGHLRAFVPKSLKDLFEVHAFKCEKIYGVGSYFLPSKFSKYFSKITLLTVYITIKVRKPER